MSKFLLVSAVFASTVMGPLEAGFHEDFESFQSRHPGVQQSVQGVMEYKDDYPLEKWQGEEDTAIKLYGLFNFMGAQESELAQRRDEFIKNSGYKNFPNSEEHPHAIVAFSKAMKPLVEEIIKTARPITNLIENLYNIIADKTVNPDTIVRSLEWSLTILTRIDEMTEKLVTKAAAFVYEEPQPIEETHHPVVPKPLDANPEQTASNTFLESDMLTLQVLNKSRELYNARNLYLREGCADAILAGYELENPEWRTKPELKTKILLILEENFG